MKNEELNKKMREELEKRKNIEDQEFKKWEKYPRCALLPSPEKLNTSMNSPGLDLTDTLEDFKQIKKWVKERKLRNEGFYENYREKDHQLEEDSFGSLVQLAFSIAFDAMRNTRSPDLEELVFWYYAGHGLGKDTANTLEYSSTPYFGEKLSPNYFKEANDFLKKDRRVKGGELCLHMVGFCDLYGLLKPWIAAVKSDSTNARDKKKINKHFLVILDSCHSGIIAQELKEFESQVLKKEELFLKENSVTIQAACGPDERTLGGYFTPLFLYLNDPENKELLEHLKDDWEKMTDEKKDDYRSIELPSPMVVTTRALLQGTEEEAQPPAATQGEPQSQNATMEINVQNFKLTLFPDAGFFKFCSIKVFQHQQRKEFESLKERRLTLTTADAFMTSRNFTVIDYKLKTYTGTGPADPDAGSPMGLFLLDDPVKRGFAVCAHVHFKLGSTSVNDVQRINLVHHKAPPRGCALYLEHGGKQMVAMTTAAEIADAVDLVEACRLFVESKEPGRWDNLRQWNMTGLYRPGFNNLFRLKERSAWEESYLKCIEQYGLPTVSV